MAIGLGFSKTVTDGLIFGYDIGDTYNSFKGKPTTNVFTHYGTVGYGAEANNNVGFQINGDGTFIRLGWGQTFGGYTIKPEDVVYRYNLGSNGCHYHGSTATISAGQYAIMSVDYYLSPEVVVENSTLLVFENYGGSAVGGGASLPDTTPGKWHRMTLVSGPAGGTGTQASFLYPGACGPRMSAQGYILMKNPQVEFSSSPVVTPFVNGTRSATQSILDAKTTSLINVTNVSFDSAGQPSFDGTDDYINMNSYGPALVPPTSAVTVEVVNYGDEIRSSSILAGSHNGSDQSLNIHLPWSDGNVYWDCGHPFNRVYAYAGNTVLGWHHWVFTKNVSTGIMNIYRDGVLWAQSTGQTSAIPIYTSAVIGAYTANGSTINHYHKGKLPVFRTYNRELSAGEVKQNFGHYKTRFNIA